MVVFLDHPISFRWFPFSKLNSGNHRLLLAAISLPKGGRDQRMCPVGSTSKRTLCLSAIVICCLAGGIFLLRLVMRDTISFDVFSAMGRDAATVDRRRAAQQLVCHARRHDIIGHLGMLERVLGPVLMVGVNVTTPFRRDGQSHRPGGGSVRDPTAVSACFNDPVIRRACIAMYNVRLASITALGLSLENATTLAREDAVRRLHDSSSRPGVRPSCTAEVSDTVSVVHVGSDLGLSLPFCRSLLEAAPIIDAVNVWLAILLQMLQTHHAPKTVSFGTELAMSPCDWDWPGLTHEWQIEKRRLDKSLFFALYAAPGDDNLPGFDASDQRVAALAMSDSRVIFGRRVGPRELGKPSDVVVASPGERDDGKGTPWPSAPTTAATQRVAEVVLRTLVQLSCVIPGHPCVAETPRAGGLPLTERSRLCGLLLSSFRRRLALFKSIGSSLRDASLRHSIGEGNFADDGNEAPLQHGLSTTLVPRQLHFVTSDAARPFLMPMLRWFWQWRRYEPEYQVRVWGAPQCRELAATHKDPALLAVYDAFPLDVSRADVCRLLVVHRHGGVYLDQDMQWRVPLSRWLTGASGDPRRRVVPNASFFGIVEWHSANTTTTTNGSSPSSSAFALGNFFLATAKDDPVVERALQLVVERAKPHWLAAAFARWAQDKEEIVLHGTGPRVLTDAFVQVHGCLDRLEDCNFHRRGVVLLAPGTSDSLIKHFSGASGFGQRRDPNYWRRRVPQLTFDEREGRMALLTTANR